jgi:N-acetylglucosaminyldiphosphoundecaprenol N-acetyl-beta-D-mannosaminyltransferase
VVEPAPEARSTEACFTEDIIGFQVTNLGVQGSVEAMGAWVVHAGAHPEARVARWCACLNPHSHEVAQNDQAFAAALRAADWLVPDGMGVVAASRLLGGTIRERVTGSDVFCGLMRTLNEAGGCSAYFLGASEETLRAIASRASVDYPRVRIAGLYSPPFKASFSAEETAAIVRSVNLARPDVLWVGMSAPKQEKWIYEALPDLDVAFAGAIGAVFDFYAGRVNRAPSVFQRLGLEWLVRFVQEPRRLWRRYCINSPLFMLRVMRAAVFGTSRSGS